MNSNRLIGLLIAMTMVMQGVILYRQYHGPQGQNGPPPIRDAEKDAFIDLTNLPIEGRESATVVLVEFSDYECPFCQSHAAGVGRDLQQKYISTGQIRHAFVDHPLSMHAHAKQLAAAAICAGKQGAYWKMHDLLFKDKPTTKEGMLTGARQLSLDPDLFEKCLDSDLEKTITQGVQVAERLSLPGTPAFALGWIESGGRVRVSKLISGALPLNLFETAINEVVTGGAKSPFSDIGRTVK